MTSHHFSRKIRIADLAAQYHLYQEEIDTAIREVLTAAAFIQGPQVFSFEQALQEYTGAAAVISCGNGTDALQITMMALGLAPGDEVIVPVNTYVATAEVLALLQITPVFADIDPHTFLLDDRRLHLYITPKTRAIVPVHLYGQCANMETILTIAARHNLFVIEDTAQALGAVYTFPDGRQQLAGTMGTMGTTSFFPTKSLGCYGDGGAIFTNDARYAEKMRMIANHGQRLKYHHELVGVNSRLDTLQAAILQVKLKYLQQEIYKRNDIAAFYDRQLGTIAGLQIPARSEHSTHVFHQYTIQTKHRDALQAHLVAHGIPAALYYPLLLPRQKAYQAYNSNTFPVAEHVHAHMLSLPIHPTMQEDEVTFICSAIKAFLAGQH
jgi:UDP-2-acetamido-2-deoxy-ribo-hexuluronate aminotransferase